MSLQRVQHCRLGQLQPLVQVHQVLVQRLGRVLRRIRGRSWR